jgi:hypothetical protein
MENITKRLVYWHASYLNKKCRLTVVGEVWTKKVSKRTVRWGDTPAHFNIFSAGFVRQKREGRKMPSFV